MSIAQNVVERKQAQALFDSMLSVARDDFLQLSNRGRLLFFHIAFDHFRHRLEVAQSMLEKTSEEPKRKAIDDKKRKANSALDELEHLISLCKDVPHLGIEYAESVSQQAKDMIEFITKSGFVTDKQNQAIDNWTSGVCRWIR